MQICTKLDTIHADLYKDVLKVIDGFAALYKVIGGSPDPWSNMRFKIWPSSTAM